MSVRIFKCLYQINTIEEKPLKCRHKKLSELSRWLYHYYITIIAL